MGRISCQLLVKIARIDRTVNLLSEVRTVKTFVLNCVLGQPRAFSHGVGVRGSRRSQGKIGTCTQQLLQLVPSSNGTPEPDESRDLP